jgi:hypothetical protein
MNMVAIAKSAGATNRKLALFSRTDSHQIDGKQTHNLSELEPTYTGTAVEPIFTIISGIKHVLDTCLLPKPLTTSTK